MRPSEIWNNKGLSDPIFILTKADETSQPNWFNRDGRIFCELENSNYPKKKLPTKCWNFLNFKSNIFGSEKDSGYRTIINLKNLNQNIPHIYFRMGGLSLVKEPIQKGEFLCKLDVKDVYFSVALHKISQKYGRFPWWGSFYGFLCLWFDLEPGPRISS